MLHKQPVRLQSMLISFNARPERAIRPRSSLKVCRLRGCLCGRLRASKPPPRSWFVGDGARARSMLQCAASSRGKLTLNEAAVTINGNEHTDGARDGHDP